MAQNVQKVKKIPERKCIGCANRFPKGELIRVVRCPDGEIRLDLTGRQNGRGAYLCKNPACLKKARKARRLEGSLDCAIPDEVYNKMEEELAVGK